MSENKHFIVSDWRIVWGYVTGSEKAGNQSWFTNTELVRGKTLPEAMYASRSFGYAVNPDICADFIFYVRDLKLNDDVDPVSISEALLVADEMLEERIK